MFETTYVCKRISKRLGILYKSKQKLHRNGLSKLYCLWIRPMIDYFCPCYDNLSVSDCLKLERLQRRAALTCTGAITRSETDKLFFEVGWPKLVDRRKSFRINLYKIMNNLTPDYLFDDFLKLNEGFHLIIFVRRVNCQYLSVNRLNMLILSSQVLWICGMLSPNIFQVVDRLQLSRMVLYPNSN